MKTFIKPLLIVCLIISAVFTGFKNLPERQCAILLEKCAIKEKEEKNGQNVRVVFYNVENLYDPYNDSAKLDDEFTSGGAKHWTFSRFYLKLEHLAKTLLSAGEWEPPAIIGMCEVENRYVLNKLIYDTPLKNFRYRIIHHESPDLRGVDVAMIYRPDKFEPIQSSCIRVNFPFDPKSVTRDILLVKGILPGQDTIFIFINHWPSRRGGYAGSAVKRNFVAGLLRSKADSLFHSDTRCKILIMGDLNDEPDQESIRDILNAKCDTSGLAPDDLVNLMCAGKKNFPGTIKYQGKWSIFDQFIVSASLLQRNTGYYTTPGSAMIFNGSFLLNPDDHYLGSKLNRTYSGPSYTGGFSDHLPIVLDLIYSSHRHIEHIGDYDTE